MIDTLRQTAKSILARTVSPAGFMATQAGDVSPESHAAHVEIERENLRDAFAERNAAQAAITEAEAVITRIQDLIHAADVAADARKAAEEKSADFTKRWAEAGADPEQPSVDKELQAAAGAAAAKATAARITADGASAGLPAAHAKVRDAQSALDQAKDAVKAAIGGVLSAMVDQQFSIARQAAAEFDSAAHEIQAVARALAGNWREFSSDGVARDLLSRLRAITPAPPAADTSDLVHRSPDLKARADEFAELAARLLKDADAQ